MESFPKQTAAIKSLQNFTALCSPPDPLPWLEMADGEQDKDPLFRKHQLCPEVAKLHLESQSVLSLKSFHSVGSSVLFRFSRGSSSKSGPSSPS